MCILVHGLYGLWVSFSGLIITYTDAWCRLFTYKTPLTGPVSEWDQLLKGYEDKNVTAAWQDEQREVAGGIRLRFSAIQCCSHQWNKTALRLTLNNVVQIWETVCLQHGELNLGPLVLLRSFTDCLQYQSELKLLLGSIFQHKYIPKLVTGLAVLVRATVCWDGEPGSMP